MPFPRALLAALAALLLAPAAAGAASTWQAGPGFADSAAATPAFAVTGAGDGSTWAAWITLEKQDAGTVSVVLAQRVGPDGARGPLLRLGTTKAFATGELQQDPGLPHLSLAPTPTGAAVLWLDTKSVDPKVTVGALKLARLGPAGVISSVTIDAAAHIAPRTSRAPELAGNAAGDLLLSWWSDAGAPLVQKVAATGVPSPAIVLPKAGAIDTSLRVALLDDGTGRVAYRSEDDKVAGDAEDDDGGLRVARLTAGGDFEYAPDPDPTDDKPAEPITTVVTPGERQLLSDASLATDGKQASVTWADDDPRGNGFQVGPGTFRAASLPATGPVAGATTVLGTDPTVLDLDGFAGALSSGLAADGTLTVVRQRMAGDAQSVELTRLPPGGAPSTQTLAGGAGDNAYNVMASLAVARDGTAVVAWVGIKALTSQNVPPLPVAVVLAPDGTQGARYATTSAGIPSAFTTPSGPRIAIYDGQAAPGQILTRAWLPEPAAPGQPPAPSGPAPAPAPAPAPTPGLFPAAAPALSAVRLSRTSFAAGTRVQFSLQSSMAGTAKVVITRATKGRRAGRACKPQTRKNRKAKACTYDRVLRTLSAKVPAGRSIVAFDGKAAGKALAAGTYKARITVTGPTGLVSKPTVLTFKITKKKRK